VAVGRNKPTRPEVVEAVEGVRNAEDGKALGLETQRVEYHRLMSRRGKGNPKEGAGAVRQRRAKERQNSEEA